MRCLRGRRAIVAVPLFLGVLLGQRVFAEGPLAGGSVLPRDEQPVEILGARLADLLGTPVDEIAAFRYDPLLPGFRPIPFQVDARVDHVFNEGSPGEFRETIYDVFHEDDGMLDENDEIVFLFADTGERAPGDTPWPEGAAPEMYEIQITDPRPSAPAPQRWAYLFRGVALSRSDVRYVTWDGAATTSIVTDLYALDFEDRWLLTGYRLFEPCGDGLDLVDRVKGRAYPVGGEEDEEGWNLNSTYLGGLVGPVRAIRYVRGARSSVNTIHHDVVYRRFWIRRVNLRVHPIDEVRLYVDWLPPSQGRLFTPTLTDGVPVDGVPDAVASTFVEWALFRGEAGGLILLNDLPPSPLYQEKEFFYRDDASWDDTIASNPGYGDDDDSAYGDMGIRITGLGDSNLQAISLIYWAYPLCTGEGDAELGDGFAALHDEPLSLSPVPCWPGASPVRSLQVRRQGDDVVLDWQATPNAASYRVYVSEFPDLPPSSWTILGETAETGLTDAGACVDPPRYYSVVAVNPAGQEGPW